MDAQRLANLDERSFLSELQGVFGYRLGTLKQVGARHLYPLTLVEAEEQVRSHLAILGHCLPLESDPRRKPARARCRG